MSFIGSDGTFFPNSLKSELEFIIKTTEFRHTKGVAEECLKLEAENAAQKNQLTELAEAAENMLTLLVDSAPIEGLYLSNIEEWDCLIKEVKECKSK